MLDKHLLATCKQAIVDIESRKFPDFLSSFKERQNAAKETGDIELETLMGLLWQVFSMYFTLEKGKPFGPLGSSSQGRTMIPEDLTEDELLKLEGILDASTNPQFVARICDVLWIKRNNYLYAQKAFTAYLQSADEDNEMWQLRLEWLARATQIAMELGKKAQERELIKEKLLTFFENSRKTCFNPQQDYWPSSLLELLVENKLIDNWEDIADKAVEIAKGFPISPGCDAPRKYYELASQCYHYANKTEMAKEAKLSIAKHWEDEARSFKTPQGCNGFQLAHRFEKAIHSYREVGEREKAEELIHELKEANKIALSQMGHIKTKMDVAPLIKIADDSLKGKQGMDVITSFISLYSPCSYEKAKIDINELSREYPLQAILSKRGRFIFWQFAMISFVMNLMECIDRVNASASSRMMHSTLHTASFQTKVNRPSKSIFRSEGNISAKIPGRLKDNEERLKADIISQYNFSQDFIASTALKQAISIILKSGKTWKGAIKELINTSRFVPEDRRDIFERAIIAGFEGDLLVFTHLIIPQIENSVRLIFAINKLKVTSVLPDGIQKERNLNELLTDEGAEQIFNKDLLWEMRSLLIEQSGHNLRNRVCHGLANLNDVTGHLSNFLLWLTLYLIIGFKSN